VLGAGGTTIATVEHLLSAFHGLGITDAAIEVGGPEVPILDGSAAPWVEALLAAGFTEAAGPAVCYAALTSSVLVSGPGGSFVAAYPSAAPRLTVAVSFDHPMVGTQVARFEPSAGEKYSETVAPARTFGFIEEVDALLAAGLARGGSFDNAIVVYQDRYSTPLRFPAELAYHKLLDTLGDLFLAFGGPLPFPIDVVAVKPSHRRNVELAARIAQIAALSVTPV
jgi:UDP-3-O-[3-hydroxymyristoyl] N-acetylglucosamine deacetylase